MVLTGPRQSGKTTLLKHAFGSRHRYLSLEPPDVRAAAAADPRGFLALHAPPVILDEIQYAPGLLPYVKEIVDARRSRAGQFLLTGSQNLGMSAAVTESLAGRAAMLRLLPLSWREIARDPERRLPWDRSGKRTGPAGQSAALWPAFVRGTYPELTAHPRRDAELSSAGKPHPPITVPVRCRGQTAVAPAASRTRTARRLVHGSHVESGIGFEGSAIQLRAVAKHRLRSPIAALDPAELHEVCQAVSSVLELR